MFYFTFWCLYETAAADSRAVLFPYGTLIKKDKVIPGSSSPRKFPVARDYDDHGDGCIRRDKADFRRRRDCL